MSEKKESIYALFGAALKGGEEDYTSINLKRAIILLAIPMIIEMLMESLFAVVDIFFVGKLGADAVSAVGITESVLTIVYSLGFGLSMAATAMVARRIGEKNKAGAEIAAGQAIIVGFLLAAIISVIGIFFSDDILRLVGADENVVAIGSGFTKWMLGGNLVIMLLFLLNGVFRGAGNASIAMKALWISNSLNIVLDPLLIFGLGSFEGFGLEGAAIATNIGRGIGVLFQLSILFGPKGMLQLKLPHLKFNKEVIGRLLKTASGGTGQFVIASASWLFLMSIMTEFGSAAVAGYTIGIRVIIFTILPAWGLANAAATLVGQNLGAGKPDRAEAAVWTTARYCMYFLGAVSILYFIFAKPIIGFFIDDEEVFVHGVNCLRYLSVGYVVFAYGMVIAQAFNGAGDTRTPTIMNFVCFWLIQIPLGYILAKSLGIGPKGVYLAVVISEVILAIIGIIWFRRGKWKLQEI